MERIIRTVIGARNGSTTQTRRAWSPGPRGRPRPAPPRPAERRSQPEQPLRVRPVMPPHYSPNFTYEQALEGWRRLEEEKQARWERAGRGRGNRARVAEAPLSP